VRRRVHNVGGMLKSSCTTTRAHALQVGFIANLSGEKNHKILQQVDTAALQSLMHGLANMLVHATGRLLRKSAYNGASCVVQHSMRRDNNVVGSHEWRSCRPSRLWGAWSTAALAQRTKSLVTGLASWPRFPGRLCSRMSPRPTPKPAGAAPVCCSVRACARQGTCARAEQAAHTLLANRVAATSVYGCNVVTVCRSTVHDDAMQPALRLPRARWRAVYHTCVITAGNGAPVCAAGWACSFCRTTTQPRTRAGRSLRMLSRRRASRSSAGASCPRTAAASAASPPQTSRAACRHAPPARKHMPCCFQGSQAMATCSQPQCVPEQACAGLCCQGRPLMWQRRWLRPRRARAGRRARSTGPRGRGARAQALPRPQAHRPPAGRDR
jgi:hypothetical protein